MTSRLKRLLLAALLFAAVGSYFIRTQTGVSPPEPADFSALDSEIADNIRAQIEIVNSRPRDQSERNRLGMIYEANALYGLALQTYQQSLDQQQAARIWFRTAICAERQGNLEDAIAAMLNCTQMQPDYAPAWWRLGFWQLDAGQLNNAKAAARRAQELDADDSAVWFLQTRILLEESDHQAAIQTIEKHGLFNSANRSYAMFLLGTALRQAGQPEQARPYLQRQNVRPVWSDPWTAEVKTFEAGLPRIHTAVNQLLRQGQANKAIPLLLQARRRDANNTTTLNLLGVCYFQTRQMNAAAEQFEAVLKQKPHDFDANLNLSQVLVTGSKPQTVQRALEHARRAVAAKPLAPKAHAASAQCLQRLGKIDEAIRAFESAFTYDARSPEFALLAGQVELQAGRLQAAEQRFRAQLKSFPQHSSVLLAVAQVLTLQQRQTEAVAFLKQAAKVRPASPQDRIIAEQKLKELQADSSAPAMGPQPLK